MRFQFVAVAQHFVVPSDSIGLRRVTVWDPLLGIGG